MQQIQFTPYITKISSNTFNPDDIIQIEPRKPVSYTKQYDLTNDTSLSYTPPKTTLENSPLKETGRSRIQPIKGVNMENLNKINDKLTDAGYNKTQRAVILATVIKESKANPIAIGDNGLAKGLFQGHAPRFTAGNDLDSQIDLIISEIRDLSNVNGGTGSKRYSKKNAYDTFHGDDLLASMSAFTSNFIRPANQQSEINERYKIAQQIYNQLA